MQLDVVRTAYPCLRMDMQVTATEPRLKHGIIQDELEVSSNRGSGDLGRAAARDSTASSDQASPRSTNAGKSDTGRGAASEASAESVEAHILARIAAICQPGAYSKPRQLQVHVHVCFAKHAWPWPSIAFV